MQLIMEEGKLIYAILVLVFNEGTKQRSCFSRLTFNVNDFPFPLVQKG